MITTYLLQKCKHCKELLKYIKKNPNLNICLIIVSKDDIKSIKRNEPRIKQFPVAFTGNPKMNGLPYKNSHMISGSGFILNTLKNNFGKKLTGSNLPSFDYDYDNKGNISSLNNIREHRNNCFGKNCYVMDRPYGPSDNQFILQGYQPACARPLRSNLPVRGENKCKFGKNYKSYKSYKFGMTTPGTRAWQNEGVMGAKPLLNKSQLLSNKLVNPINCSQKLNADSIGFNTALTFSNDYLNRECPIPVSKFGKYKKHKLNKFGKDNCNTHVRAPVNSTYPFLTYAAGGNTISRITGQNYLPEQIPIGNLSSAYISGNIKDFVKNNPSQKFLSDGLNSKWSINAQGINKYGKSNKSCKSNNGQQIMGQKIVGSWLSDEANKLSYVRTVAGKEVTSSQAFQSARVKKMVMDLVIIKQLLLQQKKKVMIKLKK